MTIPRSATAAFILALVAGAAPGQEVTFIRIIGNGDLLPNGETFGGGGLPAIDGDYVAMNAGSPSGYRAIIAYHIPTGEITILADTTSISPTWGEAFKTFGNPSICEGEVVYPGAALLFTSEWDGLYRTPVDRAGDIHTVVDELHPFVITPTLQAINDHGVAYTEKAAARGPIYFTDLGGAVEPVALPGAPTPDGGVYGSMDPPVAGGDLVAFQEFSPYSVYAWNARTRETDLVIQVGQPVPGQPGEVFEVVDVADTDGQRTLVTGAYGQLHDTYRGIYAWDGSTLELLVQNTDPVPGGGGTSFESIYPLAIDGDLAVFRSEGILGEHNAIFGVRVGGEPFLIVGRDQMVAGDLIIHAMASDVALSGNRLLFNGRLDLIGRTAYYIAELDFDTCAADLNGDGVLDFFDFLAFQNLFAAGDPRADFDGSGSLDFFDFLAFQDAFAAGCP